MSVLNSSTTPSSKLLAAILLGGVLGAGAGVGWTDHAREPSREQLSRLSEEMEKASRELRYQAEQTVYEYLGDRIQVTRYRVQHSFPYMKREVISGPEGAARVVILQDGGSLWSYFPERGIVVKEEVEPPSHVLPVKLPANLDLLARNYRVVVRGPVTLDDGLECEVVEFLPRKPDRPSRELWLEVQRRLPIRMYMVFPDGRTAYRTELQRIRWDPDFREDTFRIKVPRDTKVFEIRRWSNMSLEEARRLLNRPVTLPLFVPDGYAPADIVLRLEAPRKRLQVIYSDGLSSYSVFQEWTEPSGGRFDAGIGDKPVDVSLDEPGSRKPEEEQAEADESPPPADSVPHAYRYGLITIVTHDHGGRRTVGVGDVHEKHLRNVVRSLMDAE